MTLLQSSEINYQSLDSLQSVSLCDAFLVCFYSHCDPTLKAISIAMPITHPAIVFVFLAMLQGVHTLASLSPCSPVPRPQPGQQWECHGVRELELAVEVDTGGSWFG